MSDIIILADDVRYSDYLVKIAIVGVPGDIHKYFAVTKNASTIFNRLREISEVSRLNRKQCDELVKRGFDVELKCKIDDADRKKIFDHISWVTDRIPERVQQYCLELAFLAEKTNFALSFEQTKEADAKWVKTSLLSDYAAVESHMNSRETKLGRRNQTIYAVGAYDGEDFKATDIDEVVRMHFSKDSENIKLNISQILTKLASGDSPLIKRNPKGNAYRLASPKFRMCIRVMLRKNAEGGVEKVELQGIR